MHAGRLALALLAVTAAAGCLGVDNMRDFKTELGAHQVPDPPTATYDASATEVLPDERVTFTAAASQDPLGDGLTYRWTFGDGTSEQGRQVAHAWTQPGTYPVTLTVSDARGRTDEATTTIRVGTPNRAPTADVVATTPSGDPADEASVGTTILFSAEGSSDPDGDPLTYDWRLGDGTSAEGAEVGHAFQAPGRYPVTVTVTDPEGASDEATLPFPVTLARTWEDNLAAPNTTEAHAFPVAEGARVVANLTFPAGPLGGNDLDLVLRDPDGQRVAASEAATPLGAEGTQYEEVVLEPGDVDAHPAGAWTAEVQRASGGDVDYTLAVTETFPPAE